MRWFFERLWMRVGLGFNIARQIETFFTWVSTIVEENDVIEIKFPGYHRFFSFSFPHRYKDSPKLVPSINAPTFFASASNKLGHPWHLIWGERGFFVFENALRHKVLPARFGFETSEMLPFMRYVRKLLEKSLYGEDLELPSSYGLSPRFLGKGAVGVSFWINGSLRGSMIAEGYHFSEGVRLATHWAAKDARFVPISLEELPHTRIEVTLIFEPKFPVTSIDRKQKTIDTDKAHISVLGEKRGWYLPEVFNAEYFSSYAQFLQKLAQDKAGFSKSEAKKAKYLKMRVVDYIESADQKTVLQLRGPIIKNTNGIKDLEARCRQAADWVIRNQNSEGKLTGVIRSRGMNSHDIVRETFSAWALALFANALQDRHMLSSASKALHFYKDSKKNIQPSARLLFLSYLGNLAHTLQKHNICEETTKEISRLLPITSFDPITMSQTTAFLNKTGMHSEISEILQIQLKRQFKEAKKNPRTSLASWAEIAHTFRNNDHEFAKEVRDWLISHQHPDGSFPDTPESNFAYTRGTGKILEVLASDYSSHQSVIERGLNWTASMQYDKENTFFLSPEKREWMIGGFRHDAANPDAWIDAAGHFLILGTRVLKYGTSSRES